MAKKDKVYKYIIDALEKGTVPWRRPFLPMTSGYGHQYRGINKLVLNISAQNGGYKSPIWFTFKKAKELGGKVRKGEKGTAIFYYAKGEYEDDDGNKQNYMSQRVYHVFNKEQIEWDPEMNNYENFIDDKEFHNREHDSAMDICAEYLYREKLKVTHVPGSAYYSPTKDYINVPDPKALVTYDDYYPILFHEMAHSTGAKNRLDRDGITKPNSFGSHEYSQEELVAEMTSAYLCGRTNWNVPQLDQSAAYIQGWLKVLDGNKEILQKAASEAEKAYEFILGKEQQHEQE